jgi:hypothetical protein
MGPEYHYKCPNKRGDSNSTQGEEKDMWNRGIDE